MAEKACRHVKKDGSPCPVMARPGKRYCTFHDPSLAKARAEGRSKGGSNRKAPPVALPPETPAPKLETAEDLKRMLADDMHALRTGRLEPRIGNSICFYANLLLRIIEGGELAKALDRIAALESRR